MTPREAATVAAQRWGFWVFPIAPLHKAVACNPGSPCHQYGCRHGGWKDWPNRNTNDPAFIAEHWPSPHHNYGIACKGSGLVVLDLDVDGPDDIELHNGVPAGAVTLANCCDEHGQEWPGTLTIVTPRGGWHLIFRAIPGRPVGNSAGTKVGRHVDIRGAAGNGGGYVVGPGSVIDERAYDKPVSLINGGQYIVQEDLLVAPLPDWIAALTEPPQVPAVPAVQVPPGRAGSYADAALRRELETVLAAPVGQRNTTLNTAAFSLGQLVAGGALERRVVVAALLQAGEGIGLSDTETERTVYSGLAAGAKQPRGGAAA